MRLAILSFALNVAAFCMLTVMSVGFLLQQANFPNNRVDHSVHESYYFVPDQKVVLAFGGAFVVFAAGLVAQLSTLKKGDQ
jgi:hypothetical protein